MSKITLGSGTLHQYTPSGQDIEGSVNLNKLSDVTIIQPLLNNQIIAWNSATSQWENKLEGSGTVLVDDLTPQLGGDLDCNGFDINLTDGNAINLSNYGMPAGGSNTISASFATSILKLESTEGLVFKSGKDIRVDPGPLPGLGSTLSRGAVVLSGLVEITGNTYPIGWGNAGQVMTTDGSGALSFTDVVATVVDGGTY